MSSILLFLFFIVYKYSSELILLPNVFQFPLCSLLLSPIILSLTIGSLIFPYKSLQSHQHHF